MNEMERIAILETKMDALQKSFANIERRLATNERISWIGFGIVVTLQFVLK